MKIRNCRNRLKTFYFFPNGSRSAFHVVSFCVYRNKYKEKTYGVVYHILRLMRSNCKYYSNQYGYGKEFLMQVSPIAYLVVHFVKRRNLAIKLISTFKITPLMWFYFFVNSAIADCDKTNDVIDFHTLFRSAQLPLRSTITWTIRRTTDPSRS